MASAALFFAGDPVFGSQGIQSEFGAHVIARFQDIVSKVSAYRSNRTLASVGPVAGKDRSRLFVTRIVHGSFGFQFEELDQPARISPLFNSDLKEAVDETTNLMAAFDEPDENLFGAAVENVDGRVLATFRRFFSLIHKHNAVFKIVSGEIEKQYNKTSLERAVERAKTTSIKEEDHWFQGRLEGVLPNNRDFEYRIETGVLLRGKIHGILPDDQVSPLFRMWSDIGSQALVRVKEIMRQGTVYHRAYFLFEVKGIDAANSSPVNQRMA